MFSEKRVLNWTENSNLASILTTDNDYFVINRTTDFIYKNIQPNCWNDFLEGDRFTQNWHINKRKQTLSELEKLYDEEF